MTGSDREAPYNWGTAGELEACNIRIETNEHFAQCLAHNINLRILQLASCINDASHNKYWLLLPELFRRVGWTCFPEGRRECPPVIMN